MTRVNTAWSKSPSWLANPATEAEPVAMHSEPGSGSNPFRAPVAEIDPGDGKDPATRRPRDAADPFNHPRFLLGQRAPALGER